MSGAPKPILVNTPPITSLDALYAVATLFSRNMATVCGRLAEDMKNIENLETAQVFDDLAKQETDLIKRIRNRADAAGVRHDNRIDDAWHGQELRGETARELADNPYLLTPYRALQLAVFNKERVFEILSTIASKQHDPDISRHAEELARNVLSEISKLRLRRRRASRSEVKTAIHDADLDAPLTNTGQLDRIDEAVQSIVGSIAGVVSDIWASELSDNTRQVLQTLCSNLHDRPEAAVPDDERKSLELRIRQENDTLFSALKFLLRELESALDLFLRHADGARSEAILIAAQTKAQTYVRQIAMLRDILNSKVTS